MKIDWDKVWEEFEFWSRRMIGADEYRTYNAQKVKEQIQSLVEAQLKRKTHEKAR